MLYTCKTRRTPIDTYAEIARIPMNLPGSSTLALKGFRCLIGVVSKLPWPHHSRKVPRAGGVDKNQYLFKPETYEPKWIEFIPTDPDDKVIHRNEEVVNAAASSSSKRSASALIKKARSNELRLRKAQALITRLMDLPTRALSEGSAMFVRRVHHDPPTQGPWRRRRHSRKFK